MLRKVVKVNKNTYTIQLPDEYLNQEVEIVIQPLGGSEFFDLSKLTSGLLADKNIEPIKWQMKMRNEWK
ncbi:hypothetical protein SAMN04488516_10674 [Desulfonauticus submarinus]|uniref:Uncharacterized protein n=1 Tax=Desulfonauticus submarinus TaxID=206665 RepID=A0A1H0DZV8_9BACT|nr:hypothetical protein [Desulfonauticus submarinus]SDN75724.1 hypothetical protein SAMN04488516_10674 [Desulfonauticus submarinus]